MTELIKQKKQIPERLYSNRKLAALLIPLALDQLLNSFMGTIDTLVVSNLGSAAISAVSLVDAINILIVQAFFALASGGTVVCSHYLGCKNKKSAKEAARQLVFITLLLSVIIAGVCLVFNQQLLHLIFGKVEKDVMAGAKQYFFYSVLSYPFIALYNDGSCILRAQNDSRFPMQISIASNFLNAFLDVIFVWVFHWGVAGSAIATAGSRFFSMSIVLWKLRNPSLEIPFRDYFSIRPNWREIKKILNIGIPSGIENSMFQFGKLAIQSTVSMMGTAAIAAQGMTNVIENLNGILAIGIGIGLMTVVGETLVAGRKEEAKYYIIKLTGYAEIVLIISCAVTFLISRPIMHLAGMEAESMELCYQMLIAITIAKPILWALSFIPPYGLRAAGDVKFSMITATCTMWFCRVALAVYLIRFQGFGPIAVWIGMFADWGIRSIIFSIRFLSGKWMEKHVI